MINHDFIISRKWDGNEDRSLPRIEIGIATMIVLVANIGSTSFKYRLFETSDWSVTARGGIERIGRPGGDCANYGEAIARCMNEISGSGKPLADPSQLSAIGFKAVHAGPVSGAVRIDDRVLAAMDDFAFFAPAHNPPYIAAIRSFQKALPSVPLVALFETAFFDRMEEATSAYAVPHEWKEKFGIRRYGFHGASHRAASENAQRALGRGGLRHISCHLGGSSSMAAIRDGIAIDTSFGISPQSGLPQNNRTGDLDVFAVLYMMKKLNLGVDDMAALLSSRAGLAGISDTSGDMRDMEEAAARGSSQAKLAIEVFIRAIRRYLGSFMVELGGLDVLTFSGGIGENSPDVRTGVCQRLEAFGILLDPASNRETKGYGRISSDRSSVSIWIVPADEERIVARATAEVICGN
jgi:acetate kinase